MLAASLLIRTPPTANVVEQFAAQELQRYLQRITGQKPRLESSPSVPPCALELSDTGAATWTGPRLSQHSYAIAIGDQQALICGGSPRALLDGAYGALSQLGCRWSLHGPEEEEVPLLQGQHLALTPFVHEPPMRIRGYCADIMTWHYTQPEYFAARLPDDQRFIDWMGKSGANTFFFIRHPFDTQLTIPELQPHFARRGIEVEYGGHVIPLLLPRTLHRQQPDYFPALTSGERTDNGNLCSSNAGALSEASRNAVRYVQEFPEMSALHIWGADLFKGGWCHCADCKGVTVQDQSLRVCNAVAAALEQAQLARRVCYLAYHDTIDAQLSVTPHAAVDCEFAPRERCYGHALNDSACETNRRYAIALEHYVEHFAGRVRIFEYYGDAILYFGCAVPLTAVIAADLAYYRSLGIRDILMLQFGEFSVWAYPLNLLAFAAACEGRKIDPTHQYCRRFGGEAATAQRVYTRLEALLRELVVYGDTRRKPRQPQLAQRVLAALGTALPHLDALTAQLEAARDSRMRAQAQLLRYTRTVFAGIEHELSTGNNADSIYAAALRIIEAVDSQLKGLWGELDLPMIHNLYTAASFIELD